MNIAFSTILIILFLLPGIILRRSYLSSKFSIRYISTNTLNEIPLLIIPSLITHFLGFWIIRIYFSYEFDFKVIGLLVSGSNSDTNLISSTFQNIRDFINPIFIYNLSIWIFPYVLGNVARYIIRTTGLDKKIVLFRFSNKWHYIFSGEYLEFPNIPDDTKDIDFVFVDALVNISNDHQMIYVGLLKDFYLDKDGGLESIHLDFPKRRSLHNDYIFKNITESERKELQTEDTNNGIDERFYDIPSNFIILPYKSIINLNIRYYSFQELSVNQQVEPRTVN
jgi:hypothetical protein